MKQYIASRVKSAADYIIENNATVRETAKHLCVSKSTVHKDITERLPVLDQNGSRQAALKAVLQENFCQKHLRGGESTRKKYQKEK